LHVRVSVAFAIGLGGYLSGFAEFIELRLKASTRLNHGRIIWMRRAACHARFGSFSTDSAAVADWLMSAFAHERRTRGQVSSVAFGRIPVIQTPKRGARIMRYELADYEWIAIKPMLPNKPRGVPRMNDRR
jgi:hypothetical protein